MKRLSEKLMITFFICFVSFAMILTAAGFGETYSFYENRMYAAMPEFSAENIIEGDFFNELEKAVCDHAEGRQDLLKAKAYIDAFVLKRPVVNDVVITKDALLEFNKFENVDEEDIKQQAEEMAKRQSRLKDIIEEYGGDYLYMAVPCQYACYEDSYPFYLNSRREFTECEIENLSESMEKYKVSFIDMLPVFENSKENNREQELFYSSKIDNHYGLKGAYIAYKELINRINDETDRDLKYPEYDEIKFSQVKADYLGSRQRKLMGIITSDERLFKASFLKDIPFMRMDNGILTESAVYSRAAFENGYVTYNLYMGGDIPETVIDTDRPELPSILIYGDSFTNAVEALSYYSFDEMRSLDLRYYDEMSLAKYIEEYKPDIVVCIRDYEALLSEKGNGRLFE
ncbi:MAG: hypothetical protein HFE90_10190 [Firmicutes bacterium]|nr:hypothetical protein [Bacillota bacterium]